MRWGPGVILPGLILLIGLVMVMSGKKGIRAGEQIGLVILGFLVLAALMALVVNRAL